MLKLDLQSVSKVLHPYQMGHDKETVEWLNSVDIQTTFGLSRRIDMASHRAWVESVTAIDTYIMAIVDAKQLHVGNVQLKVNERHHSAYFQIYIGESLARGQGLGKKALAATLELAFINLAIHRVWLHTFSSNKRAEDLYRKFGFVIEGVERDALLINNSFVSQTRWSMLAPEWNALRKVKG